MAKAKSKFVMVLLKSMVSGHYRIAVRERLADKLERLQWDPYIRKTCLYKEEKKVRSMK